MRVCGCGRRRRVGAAERRAARPFGGGRRLEPTVWMLEVPTSKWKSTRSVPSAVLGFYSGTDTSNATPTAPMCPSLAQALALRLSWCLRVTWCKSCVAAS